MTGLPATGAPPAAPASGGYTRSAFTYDLMGRQLTQSDYDYGGANVVYGRSSIFDVAGKLVYDSTTTVKSDGTYTTSSGYGYTSSSGEYLLGAVGSVSSSNSKNGVYQNSSSTTNVRRAADGRFCLRSIRTWQPPRLRRCAGR